MSTELATALTALGVAMPTPPAASGGAEMTFTPPTTTTFPVFRSGNSSTGAIANLSSSRGVRLSANMPSGNVNSLTYAMVAATPGAGGNWSAIARLRRHLGLQTWGFAGMIIRNSADNKSRQLWLGNDSTVGFCFNHFSGDDSWAAVGAAWQQNDLDWWQRVRRDSTNIYWEISKDGEFWINLQTDAIASIYTGNPTHVGIAINPNFGGSLSGKSFALDCLSWSFTSS